MFVNCLVKQFAICFGVVAILLLNVMAVFSVEVLCRIDRVWSSKELRVVPVIPGCAFTGRPLAFGEWNAFQWSPTGRVEIKLTTLWL